MHGQLKRAHSPDCSDTDCSDDGTDVCAVTGSCDGSIGSGPNSTRKRRRGAIEKRRRDRINHSLDELKRLVPSALDKAGTAKLEKAEILQMTVEHLKTLHSRGLSSGGNSFDQHRIAFDYHTLGFRECATEVSRYLFSVEGLDVQNPLRNRLLAHLQMFAAQKELSTRSAAAAAIAPAHQQHPGMTMSSVSSAVDSSPSWSSYASCAYSAPALHADVAADALAGYFAPASTATRSLSTTSTTSSTAGSQMDHGQYGHAASVMGAGSLSQNSFAFSSTANATENLATSYVHSKPYRPWGAESLSC